MSHEVQVVTAEPTPTAVVAATTTWAEFPSRWGKLLDQVYAFLKTSDVRQDGHNVMLYKDGVPNVEVGVQVDRAFAPAGDVVASTLPAGPAAMTVHRGAYDRLGEAHQAVHDWSAAEGRPLAGVRWEVYGDFHPDPEECVTEVYWLLA